MSVLMVGKMHGDVATFRAALEERADEFAAWGKRAREVGAIHHRFGIGDGFVVIVDEWDSPAQFEAFFSNPELQAFIATAGGDPNVAPDLTIVEAISSADEF